MNKLLVATLTAALVAAPLAANSASVQRPKLNAPCSKVYQVVATPTLKLRCENTTSGKRVWRTFKKPAVTLAISKPQVIGVPLTITRIAPVQLMSTETAAPAEPESVSAATSESSVAPSPAESQPTVASETASPPAPEPAPIEASAPQAESTYPVVADPANGGSPEVVEVDPATTEQANPALPAKVSDFVLSTLSENSAAFTLTPIAGVSLYQVYVRYGDSFTLRGVDQANPEVVFNGLTADWDYTACAYYFLNSVESEKACISFHTPGTRPVVPVTPAGPAAVSATATETTITVNWSAVADATSYALCHVREDSMQCGGYTMLSETSAIFQDGSVSAGWDYKVRVQAVFADGSRSLESQTTVRSLGSRPTEPAKLAGVTNFRVIAVTPTSATLAWDYADSSAITVWGVTARHLTSYTATGAEANAREFTIRDLSPGLGYEFTIEGRTEANVTETSSTNALLPSS